MNIGDLDPSRSAAFLLFLFFLPPLIAVIKQSGLSAQINALLAQVVYVIVGIGAAVLSGIPVTFENAVPLITIATVVGSAAYKLIWSNIGGQENSLDKRITDATSIVKGGGDGAAPSG